MDKTEAIYDVVIIGGGPAGMAAALWCADLGLESILFEGSREIGGQLLKIHNRIDNYIGLKTSNGREMRDVFAGQIAAARTVTRSSALVTGIDVNGMSVLLADGSVVPGRSLIIATGVRRRKLGIPGEDEFVGRGVLDSGAASRDRVHGKRVVVVGGGDAAFENALILAENAVSVTLLHRTVKFSAREEFISNAMQNAKIEIVGNVQLTRINGDAAVDEVEYLSLVTGKTTTIPADAVVIRIGVEPNSEVLPPEIELDDRGYVVTDKMCMTSVPLVFAIGDIANPLAPTINGAAGDAATAVKAAYRLLAASNAL